MLVCCIAITEGHCKHNDIYSKKKKTPAISNTRDNCQVLLLAPKKQKSEFSTRYFTATL